MPIKRHRLKARSTGNTGVAEQLGQGSSGLHLNSGAGQRHSLLCTNSAREELVYRESFDYRFGGETTIFSPASEQAVWPGAQRTQEWQSSWDRICPRSACTQKLD